MAEKMGIITDFPAYRVDRCGRLYTRWGKGGKVRQLVETWREKRSDRRHAGHLKVTLYSGGGGKRRVMLAALILETFVGPAPVGKPWALHKDGDPGNNALDNLYWGTPAENSADMVRHGRSLKGERSHRAKLTDQDVQRIRERRERGETLASIAADFAVSVANIHHIVSGYTWRK
jgi:hypothetical protein